MSLARAATLATAAVCILTACSGPRPSAVEASTPTAPGPPGSDARRFRYTRAVNVEERVGYTLVTINPGALDLWQFRYALVPRAASVRVAEDDARVVRVPVRSVAVEVPTGVQQYMEELGVSDTVIAVSAKAGVYPWMPRLHQKLQAGEVEEIGSGGANMNLERVVELKPELVLADTVSGNGAIFPIHDRTNLTCFAIGVRLERHPLASAEWIKVIGLLFDREAEAAAQFAATESRYLDLVAHVSDVQNRPRVLPMQAAGDRWSDRDVTRQIVVDAGGEPVPATPAVWKYYYDYPYEVILDQGLDAEIWPFARPDFPSVAAIAAEDARLGVFRAIREGRVYHPHAQRRPRLIDPYFTALYLYPARVLADLVHILHPAVLPDHQLFYFRRIEDATE